MCKNAPDQTGVVYLYLILLSRLKREAESTLPSCKARVPPTGADAVLIFSEPPEKTWGATISLPFPSNLHKRDPEPCAKYCM